MRKILVTGATGFIGRHLVSRLIRAGHSPRVLVRDPRKLERLHLCGLETVRGALPDRAVTAAAVAGVDTIFHLAALATVHDRDPGQYMRANAQAVDVLLQEAGAAGVRRVVHVSTIAAVPPVRPAACRVDAGEPTPYALSKVAAENIVNRYAATSGGDAVIVRPTRVYGPGPWNDANGTTRLMAMYLRGRLRFRPDDGGVQANYAHVGDVVEGILLAAARGRSGAAYPLGGQNASLAEFLAELAEVSGVRRRVWPVSSAILSTVARFSAGWGRCGGRVSLTPAWLNYFLEHRPVDISESGRDLGYRPLTLREGLAATLPWLLTLSGGEHHAARIRIRPREAWA